ncbi:hypothetical protein GCM10011392_36910 [Wenxinia marina]|nr:hypothetical protein GCM10011392_36910 [Wenxinia marina]
MLLRLRRLEIRQRQVIGLVGHRRELRRDVGKERASCRKGVNMVLGQRPIDPFRRNASDGVGFRSPALDGANPTIWEKRVL